jgi:hypothetical protein
MPILITTADAKSHLRVYHTEDDSYIASLVQAVCIEWEEVTHQYIGQGFITQTPAQRYLAQPDDGIFRPYFNPVDTTIQPTFTTDALPGSPITPTEAWVKLDGAAAYVVQDALYNNPNYTYPLSFGYTLTTAFNAEIKQALLLRIGYFYSYRGDDPSPPDMKGWLMLVARHRTGALI